MGKHRLKWRRRRVRGRSRVGGRTIEDAVVEQLEESFGHVWATGCEGRGRRCNGEEGFEGETKLAGGEVLGEDLLFAEVVGQRLI